MKTSKKCGVTKPVSEFYKHHFNRDGLSGHCKVCHNAYTKRHQQEKRYPGLSDQDREQAMFVEYLLYGRVGGPRKSPARKMRKTCHGCLQELSWTDFDLDPKRQGRRRFTRCRVCQASLNPCRVAGCKTCVRRQAR